MLIDWFTVGAQIVNFLILVWLLKRYLYRPIITAIDAREKDISARRDAAVAAQKQAENARDECQRQNEALEQKRLALLGDVQKDAQAERSRLLEKAASEVENLRASGRKQLQDEATQFRTELIRLTREEIIATVRKILFDLASAPLEVAFFDAFLRRLHEIPSTEEAPDPEAVLKGAPPFFRLRSAFALSPEQQQAARKEIQEKFKSGQEIDFETAPELGLGLELIRPNHKTAWSVDSYLSSFEARFDEFVENKAQKIST